MCGMREYRHFHRTYYSIFDEIFQEKKKGVVFPPRPKGRGFHTEELDEG